LAPELKHLAQCSRGLEEVLAKELRELGSTEVEPVSGGVLFEADRVQACRVLLWVRSAARILEPVAYGEVLDFGDLYDLVAGIRWEDLIGADRTFAVQASVSRSSITDHQFAALKVKDAVVDRIRSKRGRRPNVDRKLPDVPLRIVVRESHAHVFRDLAGSSLHRRGHRPIQVKSPLSEAVAAGLLLLAGWDKESPILDPMCGSGTFLFEAASMALDRAPGLHRRFAAERFPNADREVWRELRREARERARESLPFPIFGSDSHAGAVGIARKVATDAGIADVVRFQVADAAIFEPPFVPRVVVSNPPWGGRLVGGEELSGSWRSLGTFLRRCPGATAYVLSGDPGLTRHLGLRSSRRWPIRIGQFDARWLRYELRG
jgi:putative N6-adenine-specific DNA methylase